MKSYLLIACWAVLFSIPNSPQTVISSEALAQDVDILRESLETLHPGLYKYQDKNTIDQHFATLEQELSSDQTMLSTYAAISRFTAKIQCGHTFANFWNQADALTEHFANAQDKVPFTTRIIDQQVYVHQNLSENEQIKTGDQIISINGVATQDILTQLLQYVKADGANDGKRLFDLQVFAMDNYESFDIYLPFVIDLDSTIELELKAYESDITKQAKVQLVTRAARHATLSERFGTQITTYDDFWNFKLLNDKTAYLQIGTFATWNMSINWKQFIDDAFQTLQDKEVANLILDIRGNEGGNADVQKYLYKKLRHQEATTGPFRQTLRTNTISPTIRPYLHSWSNRAFNTVEKAIPFEDGFYTFKKKGLLAGTSPADKNAYQGKVYLLADASNSSGTYFLIHYLKQNDLATIVGETSGGNLQGITAGQMLLLELPNSGIEVDIPLIGYYPTEPQPNSGITPHVHVVETVQDLGEGKDAALAWVLNNIE